MPKGSPPVEIVQGDILQRKSVNEFIQGLDVVYHLASKITIYRDQDDSVMRTNVEGTANIVEASLQHQVQKLIHFSSIHAYDPNPRGKTLDENRGFVGPSAPIYDYSKALSEQVVLEGIQKGLRAIILSPTGVIGPYDFEPSLLGKAFLSLYRGELPGLIQGGFDWVDIRDVVHSSVRVLDQGKIGERYLLSGRWMSGRALMDLAAKLANLRGPFFTAPTWLAKVFLPGIYLYAKMRGEAPLYTKDSIDALSNSNYRISSSKAASVLGHQARPIEETLRDTHSWLSQEFPHLCS